MERVWLVSYGLAWGVAAVQALTLVGLLWVLGRIHLKRAPEVHALITDEGPEIHAPLPGITGRDPEGRLVRSEDHRGRELALLLLSPECSPCEQLARALPVVRRDTPLPPEFLVVVEASRSEAAAYRSRHRLACPVISDEDRTVAAALGVERRPYGFLIDEGGIIRMKGVINDRLQLEGLIGRRGRRFGGVDWKPGAAESGGAAGPAARAA